MLLQPLTTCRLRHYMYAAFAPSLQGAQFKPGELMPTQVEAIQAKSESWNVRLVGHNDLNGHGDGMQLLKNGRYIYLAHLGTSPMALTILDASDPSDPKVVRQMPHPE